MRGDHRAAEELKGYTGPSPWNHQEIGRVIFTGESCKPRLTI